ncbi:PSP1 domain-containing protein [Geothermobacter hydrogeniphilus]|nr:stage 0 sporulation family protein [Geothermobacter hydrogeniphilus]
MEDKRRMHIVTIKFRDAGKRYHFNAQDFDLEVGQRVVVETDRGRALGTVVAAVEERSEDDCPRELKSVVRLATEEDLKLAAVNSTREQEALKFCQQRIIQRRMEMKLVKAEYLFDGSKIIFFFTADGRVDFRELVKDLAHHFHTRIEMRQIGVRDEAKLVGGLGVCGRELCCCTFLTDFTPVSVKMAKEQGLALNPNKISGQCGRLLCCLSYEFETYCKLRKGLPKCGKKIEVCGCKVQVLDVNVLSREVLLGTGDGKKIKVTGEQLASGEIEELTGAAQGESRQSRPDRDTAGRQDRRERRGGDKRRSGRGDGDRRQAKSSGDNKQEQQQKREKPRDKQKTTGDRQQGRPQDRNQPQRNQPQKPQQQPQPGDGKPKRRRRRRRRKPQTTE